MNKTMQDKVYIRPYRAGDREGVITLLRLNTPAYFSPDEEKDLVYYLDNHAAHYYVMEQQGGLIGCGGFNLSDDRSSGAISWDILHPGHQGRGLGTLLTRHRMETMIREYPAIAVITVRTSQLAWKFYEKLGFRLLETFKDYWAKGFDMYRMEYPVKR